MGSQQSEFFDGDIGKIKYCFNVPGLSFADYQRGSSITLKPLRKRRPTYRFFLIITIMVVAVFGMLLLTKTAFNYFDMIFLIVLEQGSEGSGFSHTWWNVDAIVLLLYLFLLGYLASFLLLFRRARVFQKKVYLSNQFTKLGYYLELGEHGLRSRTNNGVSCFNWGSVTGFNHGNGMAFISLFATSFLWLPDDPDGCDGSEVAAFIRSKMSKPD